MKNRLAVLALALLSGMGWAAQMEVDSLVMPACVERGAQKKPLMPGVALESGDQVRTGAGARVYLQMQDGSRIRLGEQTRLHLAKDGQHANGRLSLEMLQGSMRLGVPRVLHDLKLRVADLSATVRTGDVWAKSSADVDMLGLVEGQALVSLQGQQLDLNETMTYIRVERGQSLKPLRGFNLDQLNKWSAETEIVEGQGANIVGGPIWLLLGEFATQQEALVLYDQLRNNGYAARLQPVGKGAQQRYRVRINDFADVDDARSAAQRLLQAIPAPLAEIRSR